MSKSSTAVKAAPPGSSVGAEVVEQRLLRYQSRFNGSMHTKAIVYTRLKGPDPKGNHGTVTYAQTGKYLNSAHGSL